MRQLSSGYCNVCKHREGNDVGRSVPVDGRFDFSAHGLEKCRPRLSLINEKVHDRTHKDYTVIREMRAHAH
jgi:hypothetical protein